MRSRFVQIKIMEKNTERVSYVEVMKICFEYAVLAGTLVTRSLLK